MIFIIIWMVWFLSEVLLNRVKYSANNTKKGLDKGSILFLWGVIFLAIFLAIYFSSRTKLPLSRSLIIPYIGLFIIVVGMIFRFISIYTLGTFFTVDVTIKKNHKIKNTGVYSVIRHPSYLGSLLSFTGFGISLNNWLSLMIVTLLITIAFVYRIRVEEKALINHFGKAYLEYKNKTYYLVPWIY